MLRFSKTFFFAQREPNLRPDGGKCLKPPTKKKVLKTFVLFIFLVLLTKIPFVLVDFFSPPFTIIGFELTILFTAIHTLAGLAILGIIDSFRFPIPNSAKKYTRFQRDRFGVVVRCDAARIDEFESIMKKNGAEEIHVEKG